MKKKSLSLLILVTILFFKYNSIQAENSNIIKKITYEVIEVNNLTDLTKVSKNDGLFVFSIKNLDLRKLSVQKRKEAFIQLLLPTIKVVHEEIKNDHNIINQLKTKTSLTEKEKNYSTQLFKKYRVSFGNWDELKSKMILYPTSLILSQGAIESAWGTSRFFREANNIFGIWSVDPKEPRIAANTTRANGFVPYLRKYDTLKGSVAHLVLTISRHNAYQKVRELSQQKKSATELASGLIKYSEEGKKYVRKVRVTMKANDFIKYDIN